MGGNQGDRLALIEQATALIRERIGSVVAASRVYETVPWGEFEVESGERRVESFLNKGLVVETDLSAVEVLYRTQGIEAELGRKRNAPLRGTPPCEGGERLAQPVGCSFSKGGPSEGLRGEERLYHSRTMDIDIIFYDDEVIDTSELTVPHPRMHLRRFVLEPLNEIMPDYRHPVMGKTVGELLVQCTT